MIVEGHLTISCSNNEKISIRIFDKLAHARIAIIELSLEQFGRVTLGNHGHLPVVVDVGRPELVGKRRERKQFEFPYPRATPWVQRQEKAYELAQKFCPEGWEVGNYWGRRDSFGFNDNGLYVARCEIYRWVDDNAKTVGGIANQPMPVVLDDELVKAIDRGRAGDETPECCD